MGSIDRPSRLFDILIVGAGISGIDMAYRIKTEFPKYNYAILEARDAIGGTWDLFRYPGIRSDSDLHTFGFPWRPWLEDKSIADGESIRNYLNECAEIEGITSNIRYRHKVLAGNWSSIDQKWTLTVDINGQKAQYNARFVVMCTGYYNYKEPLKAVIPGLSDFKGLVIHPQFWPEDLDYTDKKIVIIGSGATAVTLFPVLAKKAAHVTLLQRSPSYILATPGVDKSAKFLRRYLPVIVVARLMRIKFLVLSFIFYWFCQFFPRTARALLRVNSRSYLPKDYSTEVHFNPKYNPWDQRLCVCPDGDFYRALHQSNADIVTDTIETVKNDSIITTSGKLLKPDIIITATGLNLQLAGGATITVENEPFNAASKFFWKGVMLQDLPNAAFLIGYTNASWTLGADSTALLICRLLRHMEKNKLSSAVPYLSSSEISNVQIKPLFNLKSSYIEAAKDVLPKSAGRHPWHGKRNYFLDSWDAEFSDLQKGLTFVKSKSH
ncbi:FAD-containing monooxygenase EthA [Erysiphe necator]|uniref:Putative cyclohexanone 12-monooxygenase n=1 Tax=Uncinula necator TaxID=52586 RepID=A0A0B1PB25_UNCNE|nr:FAD-containing monooxygenase EthA [Erysiphe necator]KHJ35887.1 putative cyclohexanone 12-monooxygenase [Erysiphe necator]